MTVAAFTAVINQLLPEPHAGLLNGILFGTKATISKEFMDALIATSTLHIVALSGMNITILESIIADTLLPFIGRRWASALTIFLIIGFIWFVGPSPSVIRAGIMGTLALIATIFGRQRWSLFFYTVTVVVMLLIHPAWIGDLSFQLSALATLGIILFGGKKNMSGGAGRGSPVEHPQPAAKVNQQEFGERLVCGQKTIQVTWRHSEDVGWEKARDRTRSIIKFLYSLIADDLRVTLAAQSLTIPLMIFTFRRISLVSPLTNVLIGWIIQPITVLGFIVAVLGWVWLPLGQVVAWVTWVPLQYLISVIQWTAKIPFASLTW